jgi:hypothetical protein
MTEKDDRNEIYMDVSELEATPAKTITRTKVIRLTSKEDSIDQLIEKAKKAIE